MHADVNLRGAAYAAAPLALAAGWHAARSVANRHRATVMHGHWVVPGGVMAAARRRRDCRWSSACTARTSTSPRGWRRRGSRAGRVFRRAGAVTACSADLARRAIGLGAAPDRVEVVPYGVDPERFRPDPAARTSRRAIAGVGVDGTLVFTAGRLVRKKGFEYLIDAMAMLPAERAIRLCIAGAGDLDGELRARAAAAGDRVTFLGDLTQDEVGSWLAAADIAVVPSVRDDSGNVDGLPNIVLEAMASGTALVATPAGGIASVVADGETGRIVAERDPAALAAAIAALAGAPAERSRLGAAARVAVTSQFGWARAAARFESAYDRALAIASPGR